MPKIVFGISSSFCANFLKGQVGDLNNKGWEVVIISGPGEEINLLAEKENARLYSVNFTKSISPLTDLIVLLKIVRILKKEAPDIVNAGNPKSGFLIMAACWILNYKNRIFTLHGLVSDNRKGFKRFLIRLSEQVSCAIAKKVIVVSPSLKEHAINEKILSPDKAIVIGYGSCNGVNTEVFSRRPEVLQVAEVLRNKTGFDKSHLVIAFVGRLSKEKGIYLLFEAFDRLRLTYPNLRLLVAGPIVTNDRVLKKYLFTMNGDKSAQYLGKVSDTAPVYAIADILVLASYREGFGTVLIEAASMEVPVIAPDIPGCRNALEKDKNGMLFKKADVEDLIRKLTIYLESGDLRNKHGIYGREFAKNRFSQKKIWDGLVDVYNSIM